MATYGYTSEHFDVVTEDGYHLTLFHITGRVNGESLDITQPPVMFQHAMGASAEMWLYIYPEGLPTPLQLVEKGFDVWFSNNRGSIHGQKHNTLTVNDKEFWDFSWAEMGVYDDVANTKFIFDKTGEKISYFGYSMGTT